LQRAENRGANSISADVVKAEIVGGDVVVRFTLELSRTSDPQHDSVSGGRKGGHAFGKWKG